MKTPQAIGRYEVQRLLGQGGMGRVWLARDPVLGRRVAIKVLRDDLALPPPIRDELVVRMRHEAQAAAAVSHPNIVTLHDMGEDPDLGIFLVFEYVTTTSTDTLPGASSEVEAPIALRDRLKRGPLPLPEVAKLAREVGSALRFAHEARVIHRDVKPENILYSRTGFKIADFGIARVPESTITRANTVLGTPAYTSPEALSLGEFSPASDQFSFAATLYESIAGARAFDALDPITTAGQVSSEPPPPLPESLGPEGVMRALDQVLQRGLAKTPEARYPSCAYLGEEVARAVENGGPKRTASGPRSLATPPPGSITIERTPLSSRTKLERVLSESNVLVTNADDPRPSIYLRQRTHRFQNIAAGLAILVILVLILIGRKNPAPARTDSGVATASAPPSYAPPPPTLVPAPRPKPKPAPSAKPSAAPSEEAPPPPLERDE